MTIRQAGIMLYPGAQRSEHRTTPLRSPGTLMNATVTAERQSGHQQALGPSTTRVPPSSWHGRIISTPCPNNLIRVSTFRGEDQGALDHDRLGLARAAPFRSSVRGVFMFAGEGIGPCWLCRGACGKVTCFRFQVCCTSCGSTRLAK